LFQSTPPRGGRRGTHTKAASFSTCFNPRPHAGGDLASAELAYKRIVSIHAPTRGATAKKQKKQTCFQFQSTPPRGGRPRNSSRISNTLSFNPRPHAGGDKPVQNLRSAWKCFNPRPHAGGDYLWGRATPPPTSFNPRPHAGGDEQAQRAGEAYVVSIHAPTRGATLHGQGA